MRVKIDQLISTLRAGGQHDSHGEFTLDQAKARDKMRRYQLATPQMWVTELIQAAVLKGASEIRLDIDADDTRFEFDGAAFTRKDLEELYSSMLSSDRSPEIEARRQLALGLNGALALNPSRVHLESSSKVGQGIIADLKISKDSIRNAALDVVGTRIHVRKRWRPGLVVEFFKNLGPGTSEEAWIRDRCRYSDIPVVLEGQLVSSGLTLEGSVATVPLVGDGIRGEAGFDISASAVSKLMIVSNGVHITTEPLDLGTLPLVAVASCPDLKKNVAQSGIVHDEHLDRLREAVLQARETAVASLCRLYIGEERISGLSSGRLLTFLRSEMLNFTSLETLTADGDSYPGLLARVAVWPTAADSGTLLSLEQLLDLRDDKGALAFTSRSFHGFELDVDPESILMLRKKKDRNAFSVLLDSKLKDVTRRLTRQIKRTQNQRLWKSRVQPANLGKATTLARVAVDGAGVRGEVGLFHLGRTSSILLLVKDGHLLQRFDVELPLVGIEAVLEADFRPNSNFDGVWKNRVFAAALLEVLRALPAVHENLIQKMSSLGRRAAAGELREAVAKYTSFSLLENPALTLLTTCGFSETAADQHIQALVQDRPLPGPSLGPGSRSPLVDVPWVSTLNGEMLSLSEVRSLVGHRPMSWVSEDFECRVEQGTTVLLLGSRDHHSLSILLGEQNLINGESRFQSSEARRTFLMRRRQDTVVSVSTLCHLPLVGTSFSGEIAFADPASVTWEREYAGPGAATVRVHWHLENRAMTSQDLPAPFGPLWVAATSPDLRATVDWRNVEPGPVVTALSDTVIEHTPRLLERLGRVLPSLEPFQLITVRRFVLEGLARLSAPGYDLTPGAERIRDGLTRLPVLELLAGRALDLTELESHLQKQPKVPWLTMEERRKLQSTRPDGLFLVLDEQDAVRLAAIIGQERLRNGFEELLLLARTEQLKHRASVATIRLNPTEVLTSCPIAAPGMEGEVGLPLGLVGGGLRANIQIYVHHRPVTFISVFAAFPLVAAVNDDRLALTDDASSVIADQHLEAVTNAMANCLPRLITLLLEQWPEFKTDQRRVAWHHTLDLLSRAARNPGSALAEAVGGHRTGLESLDGFEGADGRRYSLAEVRRSRQAYGTIQTISPAVMVAAEPGEPTEQGEQLVLVTTGVERTYLESLVGKVRDVTKQWSDTLRGRTRRRSAPHLPEVPENGNLAAMQVHGSGIDGKLFLPDFYSTVHRVSFGVGGHLVERTTPIPDLPCQGVISGPGLEVSATFDRVSLDEAQKQVLEQAIANLYQRLVRTGETLTPASKSYLREAVLNLHRRREREALSQALETLYQSLADQRLLKLSNGRHVSLRRALEEMPASLAHLRLWRSGGSGGTGDLSAVLDTTFDRMKGWLSNPRRFAGESKPPPRDNGPALLEALRSELSWVRDSELEALCHLNLERLRLGRTRSSLIAYLDEEGLLLNRSNPVVKGVLENFTDDPAALSLLAAAVFTALNLELDEVRDEHERHFVDQLVQHLLSAEG